MKKTIWFQLILSGAVLFFTLWGVIAYPHVGSNWYKIVLVGTYFSLSALALNGKLRFLWIALICVPLYFLVTTLPLVIYNFNEFFTGNSLFKESPGTLIIVAIYLVFLVIPSLILSVSYAVNYKYFKELLLPSS